MHAMRRMLAGFFGDRRPGNRPSVQPQYPVHNINRTKTKHSRQCNRRLFYSNILTMSMFVYKLQQVQGMPENELRI